MRGQERVWGTWAINTGCAERGQAAVTIGVIWMAPRSGFSGALEDKQSAGMSAAHLGVRLDSFSVLFGLGRIDQSVFNAPVLCKLDEELVRASIHCVRKDAVVALLHHRHEGAWLPLSFERP